MSAVKPTEQMRTLWFDDDAMTLNIIDQTLLPHTLQVITLNCVADACEAIVTMRVRGAPLIGITAAFGVYLSLRARPGSLESAYADLLATRPTAINLRWALDRMLAALLPLSGQRQIETALLLAKTLLAEDAAACGAIGDHGLDILQQIWARKKHCAQQQAVINVLTHCNAGWLATGAWGTALAPVYKAHLSGLPIHVWVDETRPRNQGASLTAWELARSDVPHTVIVDNAGGHLMQKGLVDVCLVGSDRTTANGDVCNKTGTYLKALAAFDNNIPFYAALPVSTIDFELHDGVRDIPIEERDTKEVTHIQGLNDDGQLCTVRLAPEGTRVSNFGFDVTPARLVTGLITELGVFPATPCGLQAIRSAL